MTQQSGHSIYLRGPWNTAWTPAARVTESVQPVSALEGRVKLAEGAPGLQLSQVLTDLQIANEGLLASYHLRMLRTFHAPLRLAPQTRVALIVQASIPLVRALLNRSSLEIASPELDQQQGMCYTWADVRSALLPSNQLELVFEAAQLQFTRGGEILMPLKDVWLKFHEG